MPDRTDTPRAAAETPEQAAANFYAQTPERCNAPVNDGRHVCRYPKGHAGDCYPHINAAHDWAPDERWLAATGDGNARGDDTLRLDWLEATLRPGAPAVEVFFAGLRQPGADATAFQCEVAPSSGERQASGGATVRAAIDAARGA